MTAVTHLQTRSGFDRTPDLVLAVCRIAGSGELLDHASARLDSAGVTQAVQHHDDGPIFDWLMHMVSFQGIADAVALTYMEEHGHVEHHHLGKSLSKQPSCPKLTSYWSFDSCRFHKGTRTCAEPEHIDKCPLPLHDLRNGRLNQTAYSLFLFMRDICQGDFVNWIDDQLNLASGGSESGRAGRLRDSLLVPLSHVHGVSSKVLSMALASLLLGADPNRPLWQETGASMIAIDSLVHNWLHRTGALQSAGAEHPYGAACYGANGCAELIERVAGTIDARVFNPVYPATFPRFVQKAIWSFCAQLGMNECNGNRIDDGYACLRDNCSLGVKCSRIPLARTTV